MSLPDNNLISYTGDALGNVWRTVFHDGEYISE
jgi:hypothetical protein